MSLNKIVSQNFLLDLQALMSLLADTITLWRNSNTEEQRALIETNIVKMIEKLITLDFDYDEVKEGHHPESTELRNFYNEYYYLVKSNYAQLQALINLFLLHFNSQQFALQELLGRVKRINQKHASLTLLDEESNFAYVDSFLNFDNLSLLNSGSECSLNVSQGALTLPIKNTTKVNIKEIVIGSGSNGFAGNSNIDVNTKNNSPNVLKTTSDDYFEYERLHNGPVELTLVCYLSQKDIVNNIVISCATLSSLVNFQIADILFNTSSGTVSIKTLLPNSLEKDFYLVSSLNNDTEWNVSFVPVETDTISIKLRNNQFEKINTSNAIVDRYAIAIKSLIFNKIAYDAVGEIVSKSIDIPTDMSVGLAFLNLAPIDSDLFNCSIEISTNSGESWVQDSNPSQAISSKFLIEKPTLLWRLKAERISDSFTNVKDKELSKNSIFQFSSLARSASKDYSPVEIQIPEQTNMAFALQPKLMRRGDKSSAVRIGDGKNEAVTVLLPFKIQTERHLNSFRLFVNNTEYSRVLSSPGLGEYVFNDDYSEITLSDDVKLNSDIKAVMKKEKLNFVKTIDGFSADVDFIIDPDKTSITLEYLEKDFKSYNQILSQDEKLIKLHNNNIDASNFELISDAGTTFTKVNTMALLLNPNEYFLDSKNGLLYLQDYLDVDKVTACYRCQNVQTIHSSNYDIALINNEPRRVVIPESYFLADDHRDRVGSTLSRITDIVELVVQPRTTIFSNNNLQKQLSQSGVIPGTLSVSEDLFVNLNKPIEVSYIDGRSEFLGLIQSVDETTQAIESDIDGVVDFNLGAGELYYSSFKVFFADTTVFNTLVASRALVASGSLGDYFISNLGVVSVNVGLGLTLESGVALSYYYRDPTFVASNKYSVNYKKGILYAGAALNSQAIISYKTAQYKISYNICKLLESTLDTSSNILSVKTESMDDINNLLKVYWTKNNNTSSLKVIENYFSPIVDYIAFRMK